ncbi:hypothetical protein J0B03_12155 [Alkalibacter rhizosphaerae]|uniref:YhhN-like protein n=1 Tax=Alkalibacter rhizosphaerae TaxID=2815577 RepID=A0A975AIB8_9FIRM|nr:lysoplasmalogenase family protein [Alkalibacter rhizosphaerae]QSX08514.1 hypothetical protein J0B03_12155 [Alkalibacter rhizosphaerae]
MDNVRRVLVAVFVPLTFMILGFNQLFALESPALYLKFGARLLMVLSVVLVKKRYLEQKLLALAFLASLFSDFFFSFLLALRPDFPNRDLYGIVGFIVAYLFLITAFQRHFQITKKEVLTAVPFVGVFLVILYLLLPYASGAMLVSAISLGVILCYTVTTMIATTYRGFFNKKVAFMIASAGVILFISDMVVAYSIFHPVYKEFFLWKENAIWITYMFGWLLLLVVCTETEIR